MQGFKQIFSYLKNVKKQVILYVVFTVLSSVFSLISFASVIPFLELIFSKGVENDFISIIPDLKFSSESILAWVDYYLRSFIVSYGTKQALLYFCLGIVCMFFIKNLTDYVCLYQMATIRNTIVYDIRNMIYQKIIQLHLGFYSQEKRGNIISRITNDVIEVEWSVIGSLELIFKSPIKFILYLYTLLFMDWKLTLFVIVFLPLSGWLISFVAKKHKNAADKGQKKQDELVTVVDETLGGIKIIKAFNAESFFKERFNELNQAYNVLMIKLFRKQYLASPFSEFIGSLVLTIILWYGGQLILSNESNLQGKYFIFYVIVFSQLIPPAKAFAEGYFKMQKGLSSVDRINKLMNEPVKLLDDPNAISIKTFSSAIELKNVSFSYDQKIILKNISFTVNKGETIALVGFSGGGKSTLVDLIARYYDVENGEILIDGKNSRNYKLSDIRNLMGMVTQESILFNDTVFNNITLGRTEITEERVREAATIANAKEFIQELENGYQTFIGDRGGRLSGGQRQRLCIARAVLNNPPILLLDEATSALDTASEKLVQQAISNLMKNRTCIIIAHRLSTIQHANKIIVVDKGEIAEQGNHQELLALNGVYKKLYDLQLLDS